MPDVIIVCCFFTDFSYPCGNPSVPLRHKDTNFQAKLLQKLKATSCSLKFSLLAIPSFICLPKQKHKFFVTEDCTANVVVTITLCLNYDMKSMPFIPEQVQNAPLSLYFWRTLCIKLRTWPSVPWSQIWPYICHIPKLTNKTSSVQLPVADDS